VIETATPRGVILRTRDTQQKERRTVLVLSRLKNETIVINGNIVITVVEVRQGKVRLGIEADPSIAINRGEVQDRIDAQEKAAGRGKPLLETRSHGRRAGR
jgi:carbon storage regulator